MIFIGARTSSARSSRASSRPLTSATFAVVSGGVACVAIVAAMARFNPELRRYRIDQAALPPRS